MKKQQQVVKKAVAPVKKEEIKSNAIKIKVGKAITKHREKHTHSPTKVYLTLPDEFLFYYLTTDDAGDSIVSQIFRTGARSQTKIEGLNIIWDAKEFKVE